MKRVAIYTRVSTGDQTTNSQIHALEEVAERSGWHIVYKFEDKAISGAKGRGSRPAFNSLIQACMRREVDIVAVWSIDRLGRSLKDLIGFLQDIESLDVDLYMHKQSIDTSTPSGKLLFHICGVFAEFERSIISERVRAGLEQAKENGKRLGRPPVDPKTENEIEKMLQDGVGILRVAKSVGVGTSTVQRVKAEIDR